MDLLHFEIKKSRLLLSKVSNDFGLSHVLNENPKVYISESDLIPGYLNKLQVPPSSFRASKMI